MKKTNIKNRKNRRHINRKVKEKRSKWLRRIFEWVAYTAIGVSYLVTYKLSGRTWVYLPSGLWWYMIAAVSCAVMAWAWLKNNLKGNIILYAMTGALYGIIILVFIMALLLGTNYIFPRSAPYRKTAVVYYKKMKQHYRAPTSHEIGLCFNNRHCYIWDGGYEAFDNIHEGDTCAVTIYKGLWGWNIVKDVEVIGPGERKKEPLPPRPTHTPHLKSL